MMRLVRTLPRLVLVVPLLFLGTTVGAYESALSGKIEFASTSIGAGIGVEWGSGKLTLNDGTEYSFSMNGLKIADVGVAEINAVGEVYNLYDVSDFSGTYVAAQAAIALAEGAGAVTMENWNGVVIKLTSVQKGVKLTLAAEGISIELDE
ncbi:MAG: hypothetical protein ACE5KF_03075 [Kiloniellaceae bacterium]